MNDFETISFIADEMLASPFIDAKFVIKCARLAEEDNTMYKYMKLWMNFSDFDGVGQKEVEESMRLYINQRGL